MKGLGIGLVMVMLMTSPVLAQGGFYINSRNSNNQVWSREQYERANEAQRTIERYRLQQQKDEQTKLLKDSRKQQNEESLQHYYDSKNNTTP
jgi:type III secretory pathway component EscR